MATLTSNFAQSSDGKFFSERAKSICLSNTMKPSMNQHHHSVFQFSNRIIGHGISNRPYSEMVVQPISRGRGRTTIPSSVFILQKDTDFLSHSTKITPESTSNFVMDEEVQFVRPYFGPPNRNVNNLTISNSSLHKRDILLSALKGIDSDLKTL